MSGSLRVNNAHTVLNAQKLIADEGIYICAKKFKNRGLMAASKIILKQCTANNLKEITFDNAEGKIKSKGKLLLRHGQIRNTFGTLLGSDILIQGISFNNYRGMIKAESILYLKLEQDLNNSHGTIFGLKGAFVESEKGCIKTKHFGQIFSDGEFLLEAPKIEMDDSSWVTKLE